MAGILNSEQSLRRGQELLKSGLETAALEHFANAHEGDPGNPKFRSHYGWALATLQRRFDKGLALCRSAVRDDYENPEVYLNLARVLLELGRKSEALRYVRRGLMIDPRDTLLLIEWRRLGIRRPPVLAFLPRRHLLNRILGRLRGHLRKDFVSRAELVAQLQ